MIRKIGLVIKCLFRLWSTTFPQKAPEIIILAHCVYGI